MLLREFEVDLVVQVHLVVGEAGEALGVAHPQTNYCYDSGNFVQCEWRLSCCACYTVADGGVVDFEMMKWELHPVLGQVLQVAVVLG